jgi:hypothetical protein
MDAVCGWQRGVVIGTPEASVEEKGMEMGEEIEAGMKERR